MVNGIRGIVVCGGLVIIMIIIYYMSRLKHVINNYVMSPDSLIKLDFSFNYYGPFWINSLLSTYGINTCG